MCEEIIKKAKEIMEQNLQLIERVGYLERENKRLHNEIYRLRRVIDPNYDPPEEEEESSEEDIYYEEWDGEE